jgi:hypothetical protein
MNLLRVNQHEIIRIFINGLLLPNRVVMPAKTESARLAQENWRNKKGYEQQLIPNISVLNII